MNKLSAPTRYASAARLPIVTSGVAFWSAALSGGNDHNAQYLRLGLYFQ